MFFFLNEQVFVVSLESKVLQHVAEISQNIHSLGESTYIRNLKQSQLSAVSTTLASLISALLLSFHAYP